MNERRWPEEGGEFGNEGNPPDVRAPRMPALGELGSEGNLPGLRPEDARPDAQGEDGRRRRYPSGPVDERRTEWANHETWAVREWLRSTEIVLRDARHVVNEGGAERLRDWVVARRDAALAGRDDSMTSQALAGMSLDPVDWENLVERLEDEPPQPDSGGLTGPI
jgi:hypothetical protein